MSKKRLRVEVLLAATALPSPPSAPAALLSSLLPDPTGADLLPEDDPVVTRLLRPVLCPIAPRRRPLAGLRAAVILDNLGGSTPRAARPGCALLDACRDDLLLLHTSPNDPDSSRIAWRWEWRWRALRQAVTHDPAAPPSPTSSPLLIDADTWAGGSRPMIACFNWAARAPMTRTLSTPPPWRSRMPHELLGST